MKIDFKSLIEKQALTFDYKPKNIFDGPFTGNGSTGISFYFRQNGSLYMNIGNTGIYDNRTETPEMTYREKENLFLTPRLALGGFEFEASCEIDKSEMKMSIYDGVIEGTLTGKNGNTAFCTYTAEGEEAIIFEWSESGISLSPCFKPSEASSPRQKRMILFNVEERMSHHYPAPKASYTESNGNLSAFIQPKAEGGAYCITYGVYEKGNRHFLICVISDDENPRYETADKIFKNIENIRTKHDNFWHNFYTSSSLSLPDDEKMEQFYWIQLYKCACATRSGKRVLDTAGPWLDDFTAWPGAWWNLNIELNYSLLYPSNHFEIAASLPETIEKYKSDFINNVPEKYRNGRYITIGRNTTSNCKTPCGIPGIETKEIELELGNILWILHNCYVHFSSQADDESLSGIFFENLKNAADYIMNFLYEEDDGLLHLLPTASPEYPGITKDCNYTFSLLYWALGKLIELNGKYDKNDSGLEKWESTLSKLAPMPYDENEGFKIGADIPYGMSHRHYSHLLMIYPLHLLDERKPEEREKIIKSIEFWHSKPEALLGYSQTGAASMFALLGNGDRAYSHLSNLFKGFICPNTMYNEDMNPVLETPPAAARSIIDMLMYSHGDEIRIFGAVPSKWQNAEYTTLCAECGCLVSAKRENGKNISAQITAKKDCTVRLYADFEKGISIPECCEEKSGFYILRLKKGETAVFC